MSSEAPPKSREFEELRRAKKGMGWTAHVFRSLLSADELAEYNRQMEKELGTELTYEGIRDSATGDPQPESFFDQNYRRAISWIYKGLYYAISPLKFPARKRRKPGEPIRVLRLTSAILQGGVAKVCLQTLLRMPPEYHTGILVYNEKQKSMPKFFHRPNLQPIFRDLLLFPKVSTFKMLRAVYKAARIARRFRPDIIHLHEPQLAPVARMIAAYAGGPVVCVHLHNDYNERQQAISLPLVNVTRHATQRCRLIACSQTILDAGNQWLGPLPHPIELIEDGSDDIMMPGNNEDRLGERLIQAANGRRVVAMLSHLVPHKRIEDFVMGCRRLLDEGAPIYVLLMAYSAKRRHGQAMRQYFNSVIAPHEGEFLFRVPDAPRVLPRVDIGVTTSVLEGLGLNVLEFQVEGVPVICTDIKPHREMVEDGVSGLLFPCFDVDAFVKQLRSLLADAELAKRIGDGGRAATRRRTWQKTADRTVEFYKKILADGVSR